jgi:putative solute:sodium symporter small subunit
MTLDTQRKQHWLWTIGLTACILLPVFLMCFVAPFFIQDLDQYSLLQFPGGFYLLAQGAFLIIVALLFWVAGRQEDVDRKLGASEDS